MRVAAIVSAAGRGDRLGAGEAKALRPLGGVPMLVHAVRALSDARLVDLVIVAAPGDDVASVTALLGSLDLGAEVVVVAGADDHRGSVARALAVLPVEVDAVLVHDAARPLAQSALVDAVATAVLEGQQAVVPGVPLSDTVKVVGQGIDSLAPVLATLPRGDLRSLQTPQGFSRTVLARAHAEYDAGGSTDPVIDDADLVARLGVPVVVVPGSNDAFEITEPIDLVFAEAVLRGRRVNGAV
jgi:2-C-methyl-D-erythritol 4-phosphate cytidylyltransferase